MPRGGIHVQVTNLDAAKGQMATLDDVVGQCRAVRRLGLPDPPISQVAAAALAALEYPPTIASVAAEIAVCCITTHRSPLAS